MHGEVGTMYMRYCTEFEQVVGLVKNFANKYRICDDRKKIRDKAVVDFNKQRTNYEKKQASAPNKQEEIRKLHG